MLHVPVYVIGACADLVGRLCWVMSLTEERHRPTERKWMIDTGCSDRALAKAIAFKACLKDAQAAAWAAELIRLLECHEILDQSRIHVELR